MTYFVLYLGISFSHGKTPNSFVFSQRKQDIDDGSTDYESRLKFVFVWVSQFEKVFAEEITVQ